MAESFYSRLMDVDWEHPPGEVTNFGGESFARVGAIRDAGGWSAATINAEDIDLSLRVRAKGWKILRLGVEMGLHDAKMTRFGEYWRRSVRAGYGYAEVGLRHRATSGGFLLKRALSATMYGAILPVATGVCLVVWPPAAAVPVALYLRVFVSLSRSARRRGASVGTAVSYAGLNIVCKAASFVGVARFVLDRLEGRSTPRDDLIVYRKG